MNVEILTIRDELYKVQRRVKIQNDPVVDDWKNYLNSDIVFKHEPSGHFIFCQHIPTISYEESTN